MYEVQPDGTIVQTVDIQPLIDQLTVAQAALANAQQQATDQAAYWAGQQTTQQAIIDTLNPIVTQAQAVQNAEPPSQPPTS